MKRRKILKYGGIAASAAIGAPLMGSMIVGCGPDVSANTGEGALQFFDNQQIRLIKDVMDTIIPKTDSPSATDVGVHKMIDHMVGNVYNAENRNRFKDSFSLISKYFNRNGSFLKLSEDEKLSTLLSLENSDDIELKAIKNAYLALKNQIVSYYLNTEEIGTQFLNYLPVPGKYESCITVEEAGGKLWAL